MIEARVTEDALDAANEYAAFVAGVRDAGAVVTFLGTTRAATAEREPVARLFLDHHPWLTERSVREIAASAEERFAISALSVVHRSGHVLPGEPIVFVAAAAAHRRPAFEAADYVMDRLKTDAMFWKREDTEGGSRWIEPTDADHADRARWSHDGH